MDPRLRSHRPPDRAPARTVPERLGVAISWNGQVGTSNSAMQNYLLIRSNRSRTGASMLVSRKKGLMMNSWRMS